MKVLVACEYSGVVRNAFRSLGHDAFSCDLLPSDDNSKFHIRGDAIDAVKNSKWDLVIAHPPCTYLCSSGLHWNKRRPERALKTERAVQFFMNIVTACESIEAEYAIENPIGCISTRWRKPDQIIQPHQFGHDASKATCLWLSEKLPLLAPTKHIQPRIVNGKKRWANQTDSGQNRVGSRVDRWKIRSKTYPGIAKAMSMQWGDIL